MRKRDIGNGLDFGYIEEPEIGLPLVKPIQRIMIRAEVLRQCMPTDRSLEHPAHPPAVKRATVHAKSDDAPCKLIHHHQNPMRAQSGGVLTENPSASYIACK